ncbi:MAG: hypothetical protein AAGD25_39990 [Cyanobacteria bacterium P01_F01_bin.150]
MNSVFLSSIICLLVFVLIFIYFIFFVPGNMLFSAALKTSVIWGTFLGLNAGLISGGTTCIRHFSLRFLLYLLGYAPWNYAEFLDHVVERLFLQRVGGGYIFIHRMLLEHFAAMSSENSRTKRISN